MYKYAVRAHSYTLISQHPLHLIFFRTMFACVVITRAGRGLPRSRIMLNQNPRDRGCLLSLFAINLKLASRHFSRHTVPSLLRSFRRWNTFFTHHHVFGVKNLYIRILLLVELKMLISKKKKKITTIDGRPFFFSCSWVFFGGEVQSCSDSAAVL